MPAMSQSFEEPCHNYTAKTGDEWKVGAMNANPASRTPRRFTKVRTNKIARQRPRMCGCSEHERCSRQEPSTLAQIGGGHHIRTPGDMPRSSGGKRSRQC
jgi:hypothetical protein